MPPPLSNVPDDSLMCAYYVRAQTRCPATAAILGATLAPEAEEWESLRRVRRYLPISPKATPFLPLTPKTAFGCIMSPCSEIAGIPARSNTATIMAGGWKPPMYLHRDWGWMTACKPIHLENGTILLPLYEESGSAFVLISPDCGRTWEKFQFYHHRCGRDSADYCTACRWNSADAPANL